MSDLPYLMQDPVKDELWLVTSETRLLITPEIYDLLASNGAELPDAYGIKELREQNAKLRELVRGLHMAYIGIINQCESFDSSLAWEFSSDIEADLAKQHSSYEQDRHRFDVAMRELGVEVSA